MRTHHLHLLVSLLFLLLTTGCAGLISYARMSDQARWSVSQGNFADALAVFPEKPARGRNGVLLRLERGMILQMMGRYDESAREFEEATAGIREYEDRATISASWTAFQLGSLLMNEQVQPYEGEDFEKILVHAFDAVNYLMKGDIEGSRIEIRNAYQRQNELYEKHEKELRKSAGESRGASWEESFRHGGGGRYEDVREKASRAQSVYQNAFAYYISSLVYELGGENDEAYIDLKKGIQAAPWAKGMQKDLIRLSRKLGLPEDTARWQSEYGELARGYGQGVDVFVIFTFGVAPVKEELSLPIPLSEGGLAVASFPVYRFVPSETGSADLHYDGQHVESSLVFDTDATAARNLLDKYPILFVKQVVRSYIKAQLTNRLSREYHALGAVTGTVASLITEHADLRTWSTLPKEIQVARSFVPEGTRQVTIESIPRRHRDVVTIPEGTRHLIVLVRDTDAGLSLRTKAY